MECRGLNFRFEGFCDISLKMKEIILMKDRDSLFSVDRQCSLSRFGANCSNLCCLESMNELSTVLLDINISLISL